MVLARNSENAPMNLPRFESLTRRDFLQAGAAISLGLASLPAVSNVEAKAADADQKKSGPYGNFTVGAQSYCFREFNTEQTLKRIKDLGLHHVEFFQKHAPFTNDEKKIKALLKLCKEYDITPIAYGVEH